MAFRIFTSVGGSNYFTDTSSIVPPFHTKRIIEAYHYQYRSLPENVNLSMVVAYPNTTTSSNSFIGRALGKNKSKIKQMLKEIINDNGNNNNQEITYNLDIYSVIGKHLLVVYSSSDTDVHRASMILGYWNSKFNHQYWNLAHLYYTQLDPQFRISFTDTHETTIKLAKREQEYTNLLNFLQDIFKNNKNIKIGLEYQNLFRKKFLSNVLVESYNKNLNIPFLEKMSRNKEENQEYSNDIVSHQVS